jgi:hypothetical protein
MTLTIELNCENFILNLKLISNDKKILKFQYLPHFMSNFFQIAFVKSYTWKVFQQYQECAQIL